MADLERITQSPDMMSGRPCIRGMRVTVGMIVGRSKGRGQSAGSGSGQGRSRAQQEVAAAG